MKAKVIKTGEIINVVPMDGNWCDPSEARYYNDEELDFSPATEDWDAYRREAAKDILCAIVRRAGFTLDTHGRELEIDTALNYADELIAKLKEK